MRVLRVRSRRRGIMGARVGADSMATRSRACARHRRPHALPSHCARSHLAARPEELGPPLLDVPNPVEAVSRGVWVWVGACGRGQRRLCTRERGGAAPRAQRATHGTDARCLLRSTHSDTRPCPAHPLVTMPPLMRCAPHSALVEACHLPLLPLPSSLPPTAAAPRTCCTRGSVAGPRTRRPRGRGRSFPPSSAAPRAVASGSARRPPRPS